VLALLFAGWATAMAMRLASALEPVDPLEFAIEWNDGAAAAGMSFASPAGAPTVVTTSSC
jgi:hypothetical protein